MKRLLCTTTLLFAASILLPAQTPAAAPTPTPAATPAPAPAAAKPNFSGTWKINLDKSEFGQVPPPTSETNVITQTGNDIKIAITSDGDRGKEVYTTPFTIGAGETPLPKDSFPDSAEFKILSSKGEWHDTALVVTQKITYQDSPGVITSTLTLSPDGKQLTKSTLISLDTMGDFDTKTFFDKQ